MTAKWRSAAVPAMLLLALLLGGSAQAVWGNLLLRLLAIVLLCRALTARPAASPPEARPLLLMICAAIGLILLQVVPLPPVVWGQIPGRDFVAHGFTLLGLASPWQSWSLAPYETISSGLFMLVPIAIVVAMVRGQAFSRPLLVSALLVAAVAGAGLALLQVGSGTERWYLYHYSSFGAGPGFFANSNHMAILLLACVPFIGALVADRVEQARDAKARNLIIIAGVVGGAMALMAVGLTGSLAVLLLAGPVALMSALIPRWARFAAVRRWLKPAALVILAASLLVVAISGDRLSDRNLQSVSTRSTIWSNSALLLADQGLVGTGGGTFPAIYRKYEAKPVAERTFVNHAHNDYLEVAIEFGIPGLILLALFLGWWWRRAAGAWRASEADPYAKAAAVASAAVLLHSIVDFPLRTAAIAALFAVCLGLLVVKRSRERSSEGDLWPTRHMSLD